jgi:hypothetical protein
MRPHLLAAVILAPLCACSSFGPGNTVATPTGPAATAVAVAESPLLIASKVPTCIGRTLLLGPAALASMVVPFSNSKEGSGTSYFTNNAETDCGPPYVVTPSQVSTEP